MGLKINNISGGYAGNNILKNVSFDVPNGEIVALIGLNGAGKSTTVNHIIGELQPQMGSIVLNDTTIVSEPTAFKSQLAYIPEQPILYDELTLAEHLHLMLAAHEKDNENTWERVVSLLTMFRLEDKLNWLPIHFSKGMKQKVMIICAFAVDPSLFIVDEPFLGLDPVAISDLIQLLNAEKEKGKSILMSTHVLDSAEKMCDAFVILHKGQVRAQGTLEELRKEFGMADADLNEIYLALTKEADR